LGTQAIELVPFHHPKQCAYAGWKRLEHRANRSEQFGIVERLQAEEGGAAARVEGGAPRICRDLCRYEARVAEPDVRQQGRVDIDAAMISGDDERGPSDQ